MPRAILADQSLLLTPGGWIRCDIAQSNAIVAGIDRHGKVVVDEIRVKPLSSKANPVFLGTSLSCGMFSPESTVQDSDGSARSLLSISRIGFIGEMKFEVQLSLERSKYSDDSVEQMWNAICVEAAFFDNSVAFVRYRGEVEKPTIRQNFQYIEHRSGRRYCRIDRAALRDSCKAFHPLIDELVQVFLDPEENVEFLRAAIYLPMSIAAAWSERRRRYEFLYDTLQYTALIGLRSPPRDNASLAIGRCVSVIGQDCVQMEISWDEPLWNPICNGFILLGR